MSRPSLRCLCLEVLVEWDRRKGFADVILEGAARRYQPGTRDRAFLNALTLGILRNLTLLDHHIAQLRRGRLANRTRWVLRIGLYELLEMRTPDHAAVGESVALGRSPVERGLINAVLRRAARERKSLLDSIPALPLATRCSIPSFLIERWLDAFGEADTAALCRWMNEPAPLWLRANGLRPGSIDALRNAPGSMPCASDTRFFQLPALPESLIAEGLAYVQDPSTAIACDLLGPFPGEMVLDACAAPGGKSCLLAGQMQNTGRLVATDADQARLERIAGNFQRLGVANAQIARVDWTDPPPEFAAEYRGRFDAILVDAPCTNTGVMRRRVDVRWRLAPDDFARMAQKQRSIIGNCLDVLRPGGRLVYSTCSLEPEENEELVASLLAAHPELTQVESRRTLPFRDGVDGAFCTLLTQRGGM